MRKMPPWFADFSHGHFTSEPSLKKTEIETLTRWAENGSSGRRRSGCTTNTDTPHTVDIRRYTFRSGRTRNETKTGVRFPARVLHSEPNRTIGTGRGRFYVPGNPAGDYRSFGAAKLVPAGWDMLRSLHYTPD